MQTEVRTKSARREAGRMWTSRALVQHGTAKRHPSKVAPSSTLPNEASPAGPPPAHHVTTTSPGRASWPPASRRGTWLQTEATRLADLQESGAGHRAGSSRWFRLAGRRPDFTRPMTPEDRLTRRGGSTAPRGRPRDGRMTREGRLARRGGSAGPRDRPSDDAHDARVEQAGPAMTRMTPESRLTPRGGSAATQGRPSDDAPAHVGARAYALNRVHEPGPQHRLPGLVQGPHVVPAEQELVDRRRSW